MASYIGSAGVPLPFPGALYPVQIGNVPSLAATNRVTLSPGQDMLLPSGKFWVVPGLVSQVQVADPVLVQGGNPTNATWLPFSGFTTNEPLFVDSDGTNYRIWNPTGFPIGAIVVASGGGYTSAPTVTPTPTGSLWQAVIGPGISAIALNTGGSGTGYTVPPIVNIGAPGSPGVQATATCTINSSGSVVSITMVNAGGGYVAANPPSVVFSAQQSDVNFFPPSGVSTTAIRTAVGVAVTSFVGSVMAVLLTDEGTAQIATYSQIPSLAITGGGGTGAVATAIPALSVTNAVVSTGGSGYTAPVGIMTFGGSITAFTSGQTQGATANPLVSTNLLVPRQAQIAATIGSGSGIQVGAIIDPGLFTSLPAAYAVPNNVITTTSGSFAVLAVFSLTVGGVNDTVLIQNL